MPQTQKSGQAPEGLLNGFFSQYNQGEPTYPSYQHWFEARTALQESHDSLETKLAEQERVSALSIKLFDNPTEEQIKGSNNYAGQDSQLPARTYDRIQSNALLQGAAEPGQVPPDDVVRAKIETQALIEELEAYQDTLSPTFVLYEEAEGHKQALLRSLRELTYAPDANASTTATEDFLAVDRYSSGGFANSVVA
jgi:hypothetical protein